jgi:Protein of unknown function (DUF4242)
MKSFKILFALALPMLLAATVAFAQAPLKPEALPPGKNMYVIERDMPGLGKLTPAELKAASQTSCGVLKNLGPDITWLCSYVTGDKMYCVYVAPNEELVRRHAKEGGFPANAVNRVSTIIGPKTAE